MSELLDQQDTTDAGTSAEARRPRPRRQVIGLWVVVGVFVALAVARSVQVGIGFRDPGGEFLTSRIALTVAISLGWVVVDTLLRAGWPWRWRTLVRTVRTRWTRRRIVLSAAALLAYHVTYFCYHNLKSWNDLRTPQDDLLAGWDRALFLGHSPAAVLHDLLGTHPAAWGLMVWYESFGTLVILAFPAAVVLARRMRDAYAAIAAFVWVWILGTVTYYLIPSLGPFHQAPQDFAGLPHMMIQDTQARYLHQRAELIANPQAHDAFAQIGAFASLHVGVSAVILGLAWWHRQRLLTAIFAVFLVGTMVATVYLGWHFAVDVPAGLAIAALAWWLGPRTVGMRWSERPERARPGTFTIAS